MKTMTIADDEIRVEFQSIYDTDHWFGYRQSDGAAVVVDPGYHGLSAYAVAPEGTAYYNRGECYYYGLSKGKWRAGHASSFNLGGPAAESYDSLEWTWDQE